MLKADVRAQLERIRGEIESLNYRKSPIVTAWEGEKIRQRDPELPKPQELIKINKQLGTFYGMREEIISNYPEFAAEYGGRKKPQGGSPLGGAKTPEQVAHKRKLREANLARRRDEDRLRTQRSKEGRTK